MIKKISLMLVSILIAVISFSSLSSNANAIDCNSLKNAPDTNAYKNCMNTAGNYDSAITPVFDGREGDACQGFLGLTSWDCGVNIKDGDSLKAGIWQIVVNVAVDITVIAAYLVLGYVIYGGYLYIFSSGDPNKVTSGKKTLTHAFIGLAIVMSANLIMSTIRFILLGDKALNCNPLTESCTNPNDLIISTIQWFIAMAGIASAIFVVYGGIAYSTSAGDSNKLQKAKQVIIYALIGLAIVGLAELITAFVSNLIRQANNPTDTSYQTTITKEFHENQTI